MGNAMHLAIAKDPVSLLGVRLVMRSCRQKYNQTPAPVLLGITGSMLAFDKLRRRLPTHGAKTTVRACVSNTA